MNEQQCSINQSLDNQADNQNKYFHSNTHIYNRTQFNNNISNNLSSNITSTTPHQQNIYYNAAQDTIHQQFDYNNIITVATHNVAGLSSYTKQTQLLQSLIDMHIDVIGITDTRIKSNHNKHIYKRNNNYTSWWCDSTHANTGGVGILISNKMNKFVQKVEKWKDRVIYVDIFTTQHKLRVITAYVCPDGDHNKQERAEIHEHLFQLVNRSLQSQYQPIILGDFNADGNKYHLLNNRGSTIPRHYEFLTFLSNRNFIDIFASNQQHEGISNYPTFQRRNATDRSIITESRLDFIWMPPTLLSDVLLVDTWDSSAYYKSDHLMPIAYLASDSIINTRSQAQLKKKKELRTIFDTSNITTDIWSKYAEATDKRLSHSEFNRLQTSNKIIRINTLWESLKTTIKSAALETLPTKRVSNQHRQRIPTELAQLNKDIAKISKIANFFSPQRNRHNTPLNNTQWSSHRITAATTLKKYKLPINLPTLFPMDTNTRQSIYNDLKKSKNTLITLAKTRHSEWTIAQINMFTENRYTNYETDKKAFINSALERHNRRIILDRVLIHKPPAQPTLFTNEQDIKQAVIDHFQNYVGKPTNPPIYDINTFTERWKNQYTPQNDIDPNIYQHLMDLPTLDEWQTIIREAPLNKAPGPSQITNEMWMHAGPNTQKCLYDLIVLCLEKGEIPTEWRMATIYPIPKPHEWECQLKNTRPITLLETARKLLMKLFTNRLSKILHRHNVLKGGNFAGLPGGSTHIPIRVLESLIHDAKTYSKEIWILSQDISKAFDSIDIQMLNIAMKRIKLPSLSRQLIMGLFSNRTNTIITPFGNTDPYEIKIGIDQGEVISPLLWVIYFDPLLCELNNSATHPYRLQHTKLLSVNPIQTSSTTIDNNSLVFMDDSTLISSSKQGMETLLAITEEFYSLNNTAANHNKYVLVTNNKDEESVVTFQLRKTTLNTHDRITVPLTTPSTPFRFLGVWFNLNHSYSPIINQIKSEYSRFNNIIRNKLLTPKQLTYLHNTVLLPKIEFRAQVIPINKSKWNTISSGFRKIFKSKAKLTASLPSAALYLNHIYGLIQPHNHMNQCQITALYQSLNCPSILGQIYELRLSQLQHDMWIPHSPFTINNWSLWIKHLRFKRDIIAQTLNEATLNNISFTGSIQIMDDYAIKGGIHPISDLLTINDYRTYIRSLTRTNIMFLSQLVTPDGLSLKRWNETPFINVICKAKTAPPWYNKLHSIVCGNTISYRLSNRYQITQDNIPTPPPPILIYKERTKPWLAYMNEQSHQIHYGRIISWRMNTHEANIEHWTKLSHNDPSTTPDTTLISLTRCQGCQLNDKFKRTRSKYIKCSLKIDLYRALKLDLIGGDKKQSSKKDYITMTCSEATLRALLLQFTARLNIQPNFQLLQHNPTQPNIYNNPLTIWSQHMQSIAETNESVSTFHFYTDGSLFNPTTHQMRMGFAWLRVTNLENSHNSPDTPLGHHLSQITSWPSSARAEIAAITSCLASVPSNSSIHIYSDSQTAIQGIHNILSSSAKANSLYLKKNNHVLWSCTQHIIEQHNLTITTHKIKAHSGDQFNERTDGLAKDGANSNIHSIPDLIEISPIKYKAIYNNTLIIESSIRHFTKEIHQAQWFYQLITLDRFNRIAYLNTRSKINWSYTWNTIEYSPYATKYQTNFAATSLHTFKVKLMMDELPVIEHLKHRRPDLYDQSWKCPWFNYSNHPHNECLESMDHLWTCIGLNTRQLITPSHQILKNKCNQLINRIIKHNDRLNPDTIRHDISRLPCWTLTYNTHEITAYDLIRGFVPNSLTNMINKYTKSEQITNKLVSSTVTKIQKSLLKNIWAPRCILMQHEEKKRNITNPMKISSQQKSQRQATSQSIVPDRTSHPHNATPNVPHCSYSDNSPIGWIKSAITYGNKWMDFHIYHSASAIILRLAPLALVGQ
jgi:exonuclease III/ribonuclease HI